MIEESELMHHEKAKELKQLLDYIEIVLTKQQVEMGDMVDRDVFGFYTDKGYLSIQVFFVRGSKLIGKHSKIFPLIDDVENSLTSYITKFYDKDIIIGVCEDKYREDILMKIDLRKEKTPVALPIETLDS